MPDLLPSQRSSRTGVRSERRLGREFWFPLLLAALALLPSARAANAHAEATDRFFGLTNLWSLRITLTSEDWAAMEPTAARQPELAENDYPWRTATLACGDVVLTNVAIRFKGNSSFHGPRDSRKRPFKLDFNRDHPGRTFFGLKKLSLNNNFNDATQIREALAYAAFRRAGLPAPRTAFARVELSIPGTCTNAPLGLYTLVENVDGDFLQRHFGTRKGLLLKPERLPGLAYLGESWPVYTNRYEPKTAAAAADTDRFIALARLVAQADDATLARELPERLDLGNFLRYMAVTAVLANYDSYVGNGHNYYLFQPAAGGKASFVPWDLNEAFGGHPPAGSRAEQAGLSVLHPQATANRLIERVLARTNWFATYRHELAAILTNACAPECLLADANRVIPVVRETVFAESAMARSAFQRIALGQSNAALADAREVGPGRRSTEPNGPGGGPMRETMPLTEWITLRLANVTAELAGQRPGTTPRMRQFGGGPGGPGGPNGPGGFNGPGRPGGADRMERPRHADPVGERMFPFELLFEQATTLGLTADQRDAIESVLQEARPRMETAERRVREESMKLETLLTTRPVDETATLKQFDQLAEAEHALRRAHLQLVLAIEPKLDAAQLAKLKELKATANSGRDRGPRGPRSPAP